MNISLFYKVKEYNKQSLDVKKYDNTDGKTNKVLYDPYSCNTYDFFHGSSKNYAISFNYHPLDVSYINYYNYFYQLNRLSASIYIKIWICIETKGIVKYSTLQKNINFARKPYLERYHNKIRGSLAMF